MEEWSNLDEIGRSFQGIVAGFGPAIPIGFSVTESITGDITVRELLYWITGDRDNKKDCK